MDPFILRNTVNAERQLTMLREEIWSFISTLKNIEDVIIMQDGAPPHSAIVVREWLNANFPGRWMSRCGLHEWPDRSPDLTPCDFFPLGWLKEQVYSTKPTTLEELEGLKGQSPQGFKHWISSSMPSSFMSRCEKEGKKFASIHCCFI